MSNRSLPELPCGPILELHGQRKRFHIPFGLKALLEDLTREVLREQPGNIYDFLATFMEARVEKKREAENKDKGRKSWQQSNKRSSVLSAEDLKEMLAEFHTPLEEANHHATVIQAAFRGHLARMKVKEIRKTMAQLHEHDGPLIPEKKRDSATKRSAGGDAEEEDEDDEEEHEDHHGWHEKHWTKGRKSVLPPAELAEFLEELDHVGITKDKVEEKAIVLQSAFRGMQARKKVKELRKSIAHHLQEDHEKQGEENEEGATEDEAATTPTITEESATATKGAESAPEESTAKQTEESKPTPTEPTSEAGGPSSTEATAESAAALPEATPAAESAATEAPPSATETPTEGATPTTTETAPPQGEPPKEAAKEETPAAASEEPPKE